MGNTLIEADATTLAAAIEFAESQGPLAPQGSSGAGGLLLMYPDPQFKGGQYRAEFPRNWGWATLESGIDQKMSSCQVMRGTWVLFQEKHFKVPVKTVYEGKEYGSLEPGVADRVLSVLCIRE